MKAQSKGVAQRMRVLHNQPLITATKEQKVMCDILLFLSNNHTTTAQTYQAVTSFKESTEKEVKISEIHFQIQTT